MSSSLRLVLPNDVYRHIILFGSYGGITKLSLNIERYFRIMKSLAQNGFFIMVDEHGNSNGQIIEDILFLIAQTSPKPVIFHSLKDYPGSLVVSFPKNILS